MKVLNLLITSALLLCFSLSNYAQITVSPWQIHEGKEGVIDFATKFHGDPAAYQKASIPTATDGGWSTAPTDANGHVNIDRKSSLSCNRQVDFTYFQTSVNVPANTKLDKFTVSYNQADDGARVYIFNSANSQGVFDAAADLQFNKRNTGNVDLKNYVKKGEVNRVVIVQFDDCGGGNTLKGINVEVNGEVIEVVKEPVSSGLEMGCQGSKTGAKVSFVSREGQTIKLKVDWDEGATFVGSNLDITNGVCETCPAIGGIGRPHGKEATYIVKQTNPSEPVIVKWGGNAGNRRYCGEDRSLVIPPLDGTSAGNPDTGVGFKAFVWYDQATQASAKLSSAYQYNSAGGAITGERTAQGKYKVIFPNLGSQYDGVFQVTAYAGNHSAQIERWAKSGNDLHLFVRVFDAKGAPTDGRFSAMFYKNSGAGANAAYLWADAEGAPSHAYKYNGKGAINMKKTGTGSYQVIFDGIANIGGNGGNVIATPYGASARRIKINNWGVQGGKLTINISTYDFKGQPADTKFVVSFNSDWSNQAAYVWGDNATKTTTYTASKMYQMNNASTSENTVTRTGTGSYKVSLPGVKAANASNAIATAYGSGNAYASIVNWGNSSGGGTDVNVKTYNPDGTPVDSQFSLFYSTDAPAKSSAPAPIQVGNTLSAGETLKAGDRLMSANGAYILSMQESDGNLCVYKYADGKQGGFVWGSMKYGFKNANLSMQTDGNLVVYDGSNAAKWSSQTHPYYNAKFKDSNNKPVKLVLENDGVLKLYNAKNEVMWSSK